MDASLSSLVMTKRKELIALDTQKKSLESEAEAIVSELTVRLPDGGEPIGIETPLVDKDGYPRADIDIYRARTLRKRFHEIRTDHKALQHKIEKGLMELAAFSNSEVSSSFNTQDANDVYATEIRARLAPKPKPKFDPHSGKWVVKSWDGSLAGVENGSMRSFDDLTVQPNVSISSNDRNRSSGNTFNEEITGSGSVSNAYEQANMIQRPLDISFDKPFAVIDELFSNSPASEAGIKIGDILIQFGSVNSENHDDFRAIAKLVTEAAQECKSISVKVRRKQNMEWGEVSKIETLDLKPRVWAGRGLLGCHITKFS